MKQSKLILIAVLAGMMLLVGFTGVTSVKGSSASEAPISPSPSILVIFYIALRDTITYAISYPRSGDVIYIALDISVWP